MADSAVGFFPYKIIHLCSLVIEKVIVYAALYSVSLKLLLIFEGLNISL